MPRKPTIIDHIMAEHIRMPGFPELILRRSEVYEWFRQAGYDLNARGIGSVDYMVFRPEPVDLPLTEPVERDRLLTFMLKECS